MWSADRDVFGFEGYTLDLTRGCLRGMSGEIELRPKSFELLRYLVENAGRLISKDELVNAVWPNVIVNDDSLAQCVSELRHALYDPERRIIKTVPRRGYLFAAPVSLEPRHPGLGQRSADFSESADQEYTVREGPRPSTSSGQGAKPATRRLAAILAADVVGYSRLIGADEGGTLQALKTLRGEFFDPAIAGHNGRLVKTTGDGLLVEFGSVVDALKCATQLQEHLAKWNENLPTSQRIEFRIGIHQGDVVVEDGDIFGDGVNIAVRLEGLAEPGGICVSARIQEDASGKLELLFQDLGERQLKNISRPLRIYRVRERDARPLIERPAVTSSRLSIVVLPFANLPSDPEEEYFVDGITDDLTTDLSRMSGIFVIARNTAFTYKGKPVDVRQIGQELGVRYVLEGSVRRTGEQIRVNIQLIDAETGAHLWADRFDSNNSSGIAEAQNEITGRLVRTLSLAIIEVVSRRFEREEVPQFEASDLVMQGWGVFHRPHSVNIRRQALNIFERALEIDPRSVDAKIGIATVLVANVGDAWSDSIEQDKARAERLLLEAIEENANNASAHFAMGQLRRLQNRLIESKIELETTISLDRNHARAYRHLGMAIMYLGLPEAAIPHLEKAIRLNPQDLNIANYYLPLALCNLFLGHVDTAIDLLTRARAANPRLYYLHLHLAGTLALRGDLDDAKVALAAGIKLKPEIRSLVEWRSLFPWGSPEYWALIDRTVATGLRHAGLPDQ